MNRTDRSTLITQGYPIGQRVEVRSLDRLPSWPGGVGVIVGICPQQGGYRVRHQNPPGTFGWTYEEVIPARPWWVRLFQPRAR